MPLPAFPSSDLFSWIVLELCRRSLDVFESLLFLLFLLFCFECRFLSNVFFQCSRIEHILGLVVLLSANCIPPALWIAVLVLDNFSVLVLDHRDLFHHFGREAFFLLLFVLLLLLPFLLLGLLPFLL